MTDPQPTNWFACTTEDCTNKGNPIGAFDPDMIAEARDGTAVCGTCWQPLSEVAAPSG